MATLKYVEGDLFEYVDKCDTPIIIPHVCNNQGVWGAGFVVPLGKKYPLAKTIYLRNHLLGQLDLGSVDFIEVSDNIMVANMIAQTLGGSRPLYYNDLAYCMDTIIGTKDDEFDKDTKGRFQKIVCPMFGSGLAGGDWNFIEKLIEDCWIREGWDVTVCYFKSSLPKNWTLPIVYQQYRDITTTHS